MSSGFEFIIPIQLKKYYAKNLKHFQVGSAPDCRGPTRSKYIFTCKKAFSICFLKVKVNQIGAHTYKETSHSEQSQQK